VKFYFFFSFFWAFFHSSISPNIELGGIWPPYLINPFNPYQIPLLNTIILLSSGISVTWSHIRLLNKTYNKTIIRLTITIILGIYFSILQKIEYREATFNIRDSIYGSTFFILTGFHGAHVIIGTSFLFLRLIRIYLGHFRKTHHIIFEASAWYWHFVDIVWLFLYCLVYWWIY